MEETSGLKERGRKFPLIGWSGMLQKRKSEIKRGYDQIRIRLK